MISAKFTWPVKLALGILLLGLTGPALGGREAPAVWVPLAPGTAAPGAYGQQPLALVPWTPDYLTVPSPELPIFGLADGAVQGGILPRGIPQAETGSLSPLGTALRSVPSFTLSDVLRDVNWRRQTAGRLRQGPTFNPKF